MAVCCFCECNFKEVKEKKVSVRNENVKMDVWPHKKR